MGILLFFSLFWPPAYALMAIPLSRVGPSVRRAWGNPAMNLTCGGLGVVIACGIPRQWLETVIGMVWSIAGLAWWWWRNKRRKAPQAHGAKSRARIAALVRKSRQAAKSRPVLRPVPGSS
jgi:hypothetical protein